MLNLSAEENEKEVVILVEGKLDTNSSPQLTEEISKYLGSAEKVILDLEKLDYVSSAGLRVFVMADQQMEANGGVLNVKNVTRDIMDIFEMTGFDNMLTIV
ncbi:MAG: STAS domain-containing protein [Eubacterium sp.]|nr:STAS domain-containing protein [Eubacterium sp.]